MNSGNQTTARNWSEFKPLLEKAGGLGTDERLDLGQHALVAAREEFQGPDKNLVQALEFCGGALHAAGQMDTAEKHLREAILLNNEILPTDLKVTARLVRQIGRVCEKLDRKSEAVKYYEQAIALFEKTEGEGSLGVCDLSTRLASLTREMGDNERAAKYYEQAVHCYEKTHGDNQVVLADALNDFGVFLIGTTEYSKAVHLHQRALEIRERNFGDNHPDLAQSFGNLAAAYHLQGDLRQAAVHYDKSLTIYEKYSDGFSRDFATISRNFADLLFQIGRTDQARQLNEKINAYEEYHTSGRKPS